MAESWTLQHRVDLLQHAGENLGLDAEKNVVARLHGSGVASHSFTAARLGQFPGLFHGVVGDIHLLGGEGTADGANDRAAHISGSDESYRCIHAGQLLQFIVGTAFRVTAL